jgi:hypothetical protein
VSRRKNPFAPPVPWTKIVYACPSLTLVHQTVWLWTAWYSKDAKGCTLGAVTLSRWLSLDYRTIERARADLLRWGLLRKVDRGEGISPSWFATLPPKCRYERPRIDLDDAVRFGEMLARHIRQHSVSEIPEAR